MALVDVLSRLSPLVLALSLAVAYFGWWPLNGPSYSGAPPDRPEIVCVTGVSGLVAENVVAQLLTQGYKVRGSLPSLDPPGRVEGLRKRFSALELYQADPLVKGSFEEMLQGCKYAVHTAQTDEDMGALGTHNLVHGVLLSKSVERLVITAAIPGTLKPPADPQGSWTEEDLNSPLAGVWRTVKDFPDRNLELVTLHAPFIIGAPLSNWTQDSSLTTVTKILEGQYHKKEAPTDCNGAVDVRNVAAANVAALQAPTAAGKRFLLSSMDAYSTLDLAIMMASDFADWPLPLAPAAPPPPCPKFDTSLAQSVLKVTFSPIPAAVSDMAKALEKFKMAQKPKWHTPNVSLVLAMAFKKAAKKALGGGLAGAMAMVFQVLALMWLRTTMNYQYRYGHSTTDAIKILYKEGGVGRFYQGLLPALIQGPLSRFCDTAANSGSLALFDAFVLTVDLPMSVKTILASAVAAAFRILLMPVDALKTIMQVEGKKGASLLAAKIKQRGPQVLFAGTVASTVAGFVGHYPWYFTFNWLQTTLPVAANFSTKICRNAAIGIASTICSDVWSNGLRVIKTAMQTQIDPSYTQVISTIWNNEGLKGFFRGLQTRMLVNILQGALFSVLWRMILEWLA